MSTRRPWHGPPGRPEHYPWAPSPANRMLLEAGVHPLRPRAGRGVHLARVHARAGVTTVERLLAREGAAPIAERTLVVAIGSNASPEVIAGKYANAASGCHWATPFLTGVLHGVGVGYSAHVTRRGYIPAAPHASANAVTPVVAAWFDDAQLEVVDATERNYDRVELDARSHPLVLDSGERPRSYSAYVSRHGLIGAAESPGPVVFDTQEAIHGHLADATRDRSFAGVAAEVCDLLAQPDGAARATAALHAGHVVAHGLEVRRGPDG